MDDELGKLGAALRRIGMFGNLDGVAAGRSTRIVLITTAQKKGLVVWKRSRGRYLLTPAGYRRAAACGPPCHMPYRQRMSTRQTIVAGGLAVVAGCIAVAVAQVPSIDDVRKPKVSEAHDLAPIGPVAAQAQDGRWALTMGRGPDVVSQPAPTLAPNDAGASAAPSDRRAVDTLAPPREHKARTTARTHHRQPYADPRERRQDMGQALGFAEEARWGRRGYPMYSQRRRPGQAFGQPNGWGW